jgi:hypothetical protein
MCPSPTFKPAVAPVVSTAINPAATLAIAPIVTIAPTTAKEAVDRETEMAGLPQIHGPVEQVPPQNPPLEHLQSAALPAVQPAVAPLPITSAPIDLSLIDPRLLQPVDPLSAAPLPAAATSQRGKLPSQATAAIKRSPTLRHQRPSSCRSRATPV